MSKKLSVYLAPLAFVGLALFLVSCGSSSSRPAGVLYYLSQGANTVGQFAIDLNNGALSLINKTATTCSTLSQTSPLSCGFPEAILLDKAGTNGFVLNQGVFTGDPTEVPPVAPSGVAPSIYGYTVGSDGSFGVVGDLTTNPTPPTLMPCDQPPQGVFTACDLAVAMTLDPTGKFLFVVTQGNQALQEFQPPLPNLPPQLVIFGVQGTTLSKLSTTNLSVVPTALTTATGPNGTLLYITSDQSVPSTNDNEINAFNVDGSGAATPQTTPSYSTGSVPTAVLTVQTSPVGGPGGLFVYVANGGNGSGANSLSIFQVCTVLNGTCTTDDVTPTNNTLLPVGGPVSVGQNPVALTVDPTNNFLYVVNHGSASISAFRINPSTGALSPLNPSSVSTGSSPVGIAMHSSGKFLYVSNNASSNISGFNADTTSGALSNATNVISAAQPAGVVAK